MKIVEAEGWRDKATPSPSADVRLKKSANPNARSKPDGRIAIVNRPPVHFPLQLQLKCRRSTGARLLRGVK